MRFCKFLVLMIAVFLSAGPARAEDYPTYAGKKLGRGLSNAVLGSSEILKSIEKTGEEHGAVAALFWGPIDGLGNTVKRTALGVYEVATFPIKTSENADPVMEPGFVATSDINKPGYRPKDYTF